MYQWLAFLHLVGVLVFVAAHGVSMFVAFRIRSERDPAVVASHLSVSQLATRIAYIGLVLLGVGGLGAAGSGGMLVEPWAIASYVVLGLVLVAMYAVATPYYIKVRQLVGEGGGSADRDALATMLDSRRPEVLLAVGGLGLLVLFWLMVFRPV